SVTIYNMFRLIIHVNCRWSKHLQLVRRSRHRKFQNSITDQYNDLHSNRDKCRRLHQYSNSYCNGQSYTDSDSLSVTIYNMFWRKFGLNSRWSKHLQLVRKSRHRKFQDSITDQYNDLHSNRVKRRRLHQYSNSYCNGQSYTDSDSLSVTIYNMFRSKFSLNCRWCQHLQLVKQSRRRKFQD